MTEFKVGDRVRYIDDGDEGPITSISAGWVTVDFDMDGTTSVVEDEIELISGNSEEAITNEAKSFAETVGAFSSAVSHEDIEEISRLGDQLGIEKPEPPLAPWEKELLWTPFEQSVRRHTDRIGNILIEKNKAYGDSALNPVRVFSKADREEQLYVRIDDKISRIQRGTDFANEDTIDDLIGYLILLKIAKESA